MDILCDKEQKNKQEIFIDFTTIFIKEKHNVFWVQCRKEC